MQRGTDVILVCGATGRQGGAVAGRLLTSGHKVRVMTRKPGGNAAQGLAAMGVEVVMGDLDDPASVARALDGVWGAFSVQNAWEAGVVREEEQGRRFVELAMNAGLRHLVYSSVQSADRKTGLPHFESKARVEEAIRNSGLASYTILRPVFFMENFLSPRFKPGIDQGKLKMAIAPDRPLQMIALDDIGRFGQRAFEDHEALNGRAVDLAGDQLTLPRAAEIIGAAAGRSVTFERSPLEEVRKMNEDLAQMVEWYDRVGYNVDIPALAAEFGIRLTSFPDWASRVHWG